MSSSEYWRKRESEALKARLKDEAAYQKEIEKILKNMRDAVQKEIDSFYAKYANSEGITLAEAKNAYRKPTLKHTLGRQKSTSRNAISANAQTRKCVYTTRR